MDSKDRLYENVNGPELVQNLIHGSKNIDRMREEVKTIVAILLNNLDKISIVATLLLNLTDSKTCYAMSKKLVSYGPQDNKFKFRFTSDAFLWEYEGKGNGRSFLSCFLGKPGDTGRLAYSSDTQVICIQDVYAVHSTLSFLITSVLDAFPDLQEKLQPFLDAA